jgi:hypothetical protein
MYTLKEITEISEEDFERLLEHLDQSYYPGIDFKEVFKRSFELENGFVIGTFHEDLLVEATAYRNYADKDYVLMDSHLRAPDKNGSRAVAYNAEVVKRRAEIAEELSGKASQLTISQIDSNAMKKYEWRREHPGFDTVDWQRGQTIYQLVKVNKAYFEDV